MTVVFPKVRKEGGTLELSEDDVTRSRLCRVRWRTEPVGRASEEPDRRDSRDEGTFEDTCWSVTGATLGTWSEKGNKDTSDVRGVDSVDTGGGKTSGP